MPVSETHYPVYPPLGIRHTPAGDLLTVDIPDPLPPLLRIPEEYDGDDSSSPPIQILQQTIIGQQINGGVLYYAPSEEYYEEYYFIPCCPKAERTKTDTFNADQNDYKLGDNDYLYVTLGGADRKLTGIDGGYDGRVVEITNTDATKLLTLTVQDAGSLSKNQLVNSYDSGGGLQLGFYETVTLKYVAALLNWVMFTRPFGITNITSLTTTGAGNFTCQKNTKFLLVEGYAGGGAGGGTAITGAASGAAGGGGGSGGYFRKLLATSSQAQVFSYVLGAKGTGVNGADGNNGADTTWTYGASTMTAKGGKGGKVGAAQLADATGGQGGLGGAVSTDSGGASNNALGLGNPGQTGIVLVSAAVVFAISGNGGFNQWGAGGGGATGTNVAAQTGSNGQDGIIIVTEMR